MDRKLIARKIAEESIVLLKNDSHLLPFSEGKMVAFFGRTQIRHVVFRERTLAAQMWWGLVHLVPWKSARNGDLWQNLC